MKKCRLFKLLKSVVFMLAALGPLAVQAQQTSPAADSWRSSLLGLGCEYLDEWSFDHDTLLALTSSFAGQSLRTVVQNAGYSESDAGTVLRQGLNGFDNKESILHRILLGNEQATRTMEAETRRYGSDLCLTVKKTLDTGFFEIARMQTEVREYWQPHSEIAQAALTYKGCKTVEADGLFGPSSRKAWLDTGLRLSAGSLPSPGDVIALMRSKSVCSGSDITAFVSLTSNCDSSLSSAAEYREAQGAIFQLAIRSPNGFFSGAAPHLQCILRGLAYQYERFPDTMDFVADAVRQVEVENYSDWMQISIAASYVLDSLRNEESNGALTSVAQSLLVNSSSQGFASLGLAMMAQLGAGVRASDLNILVALKFDSPAVETAKNALIVKSLSDFNTVLQRKDWETGAVLTSPRGPLLMDTGLDLDGVKGFIQVVAQIDKSEQTRRIVLNSGLTQLNYAYGTLVMEGLTPLGQDVEKAVAHFTAAARQDHAPSIYRLAMMQEFGLGVPEDPGKAFRTYQKAAQLGETAAALVLAERYETGTGVTRDWHKASAYYRQVLSSMERTAAARAIYSREFDLTGFWIDPAFGGRLLHDMISGAVKPLPTGDDRDYQAELLRGDYRKLALEFGRLYSDATSGQSLDFARAVDWLRISGGNAAAWQKGTEEQSYDLSRTEAAELLLDILKRRPDLAANSTEVAVLTKESGNEWDSIADVSKAAEKMAVDCPISPAKYDEDCPSKLRRAAIGLFGTELISVAFAQLTAISNAELEEIAEFGRLKPNAESLTNGQGWGYTRRPQFTFQLVDVLAFFGDYEDAERRARLGRGGVVEASLGPLRRQVARSNQTGEHIDGLEVFLNTVARQGSSEARDLLAVLRGQDTQSETVLELSDARVRFDNVAHLTSSLALASTARRLAPLEAEDGNTGRAIELEMIALKSDLDRHQAAGNLTGPIGTALANVCSMSKTSARLFGYDAPEIALLLAKQAVNRLQQTRSALVTLPERMQLCFRSQVENHYRWLADLMISQNRPQEASRVLEMLKDFESFEFSGRERGLIGDAYDTLPFSATEQDLLEALADITPPDGVLMARQLVLENLALGRGLTAGEQTERAGIAETLAQNDVKRQAALDKVLVVAIQVKTEGEAPDFAADKLMKRYLNAPEHERVAILQYVVLEDRFGLVLTTSSGQQVWTWDQLGNGSFSETELDSLVANFRTDVLSTGRDPRKTGQALFDLLLPSDVMQVLEAQSIRTLVLSLDRHLRYVPMAALFDGENWLAEQFVLSHVSVGTLSDGVSPRSNLIAGFGATKSFHGLPALAAVETEVKAVVQEADDDAGFIRGTAMFDQDFTRETLVDALSFGGKPEGESQPALGVLHLASHFRIGQTEADSALLLGNGDLLSVKDIREGMGVGADLSQVSLLTLSACETGFGNTGADGRELESVAAIAQHKGAKAVMASLLPVPDTATAALMVEFYRNYANNMPLAEALRRAQMSVMSGEVDASDITDRGAVALSVSEGEESTLAGWQHPRFWASFVLMEGSL